MNMDSSTLHLSQARANPPDQTYPWIVYTS